MSDFLLEMQNFFGGNADDDTLRMNDPKAVEKFYSKLALSYNMDELQGILDCDDNMLIIACAGAGKTTTLLLKIIRDVLSGRLTKKVSINGNSIITVKKILVSTFLKTGAEDLAKKFDELCMKYKVEGLSSKNVAFRTIDSEVYNALKDMLGKDGFNLDEEKAVSFLKDACSLCQISSVQGNSKNRRVLTKEELSEISCLITYCRSRLDDSKFNHPLMDEYNLTKIDIINLLDKYKILKELNGVNDYQDLEEILEEGLRLYPNVVDNIKKRYDFVYVDEFQDISQLQYSIFRTYFKYAEGIIAIGDDDQCFPCNFKVSETFDKKIQIGNIEKNTKILTVSGRDKIMQKNVDYTSKKYINSDIISIITKSGRTLLGTKSHIMFTRFNPLNDVYTVYLMYRDDFGFRIGLASGNRLDGHGNNRIGIAQRLNKEKGDKVWILKECEDKKEGLYWEKYYSQKYGIPTYMFKIEKAYQTHRTEDDVREMHQEINSFNRGFMLLSDIGYDFEYSHYLPKVRDDKCALYYTMFGSNLVSKDGIQKSTITVDTSNEMYAEIMRRHLSVSLKNPKGNRKPYWSCTNTTAFTDLQEKKIKEIVADCNDHNLPLIVKKQIRIGVNRYDFMPLCNVVKGMIIPVVENGKIVEDEIVEVKTQKYEGYVCDVSVPNTRNFIINDIVVHNCIYGWRGSDVSIITERFSEDFKPTIKHLTVNRRCPKTILNAVIPSIENNDNRHPKQLQASKEGGKIEIVVDGGMKFLSDSLKEDLAKSERVGILGRTNADLLVPALVLLLNNYTSFTVSKQVSLSNRVPTRVLGVMDLITQRYNENFEDYFKIFTNKGSNLQATKLANVLAIDPNLSLYNIPLDDIMYTVPDLCPLIRLLRAEKDKDPVGAYIKLLDYMERDVYTSKTIYAQRTRDFIYYIKHLIREHDLLKDKTIEELQHLFKVEIAEKLEARIVKKQKRKLSNGSVEYYTPEDNSYVRITTIHDAKGKEWDNVYIWNDIDGCFPNSVGTRDLTDEEFEEERRIHYIAWTRAKKKLVVFTRSDANPGFLGECDLSSSEIITKKETLSTSKFNSKGQMHRKEEKANSWENYFKSYVQKYTSYDKICTVQGTNLDICMTKLGGVNGVIEYLKGYGLEHYPLNELEGLISDLLEEKANSYS